ncbi:MAG: hypothetical protein HY928_06805 [Elusimicrobia bacterium]|nr:hypothetical protein [Elusimicrobiota bacterium]
MVATRTTPTPDFDLSDFAVDDDVSLADAAAADPEPAAKHETAPARPAPAAHPAAPVAPAAPSAPARVPEQPAAASASPVSYYQLPGRSSRVAVTYWVTPELRRAIRQSMVGPLEGVYRSQGDLVEAAVRRFLNPG